MSSFLLHNQVAWSKIGCLQKYTVNFRVVQNTQDVQAVHENFVDIEGLISLFRKGVVNILGIFRGGKSHYKNFQGEQGHFIVSREGLEKECQIKPKTIIFKGVNQILRKFQRGLRICEGVRSILNSFQGEGIFTLPKFQGDQGFASFICVFRWPPP